MIIILFLDLIVSFWYLKQGSRLNFFFNLIFLSYKENLFFNVFLWNYLFCVFYSNYLFTNAITFFFFSLGDWRDFCCKFCVLSNIQSRPMSHQSRPAREARENFSPSESSRRTRVLCCIFSIFYVWTTKLKSKERLEDPKTKEKKSIFLWFVWSVWFGIQYCPRVSALFKLILFYSPIYYSFIVLHLLKCLNVFV